MENENRINWLSYNNIHNRSTIIYICNNNNMVSHEDN